MGILASTSLTLGVLLILCPLLASWAVVTKRREQHAARPARQVTSEGPPLPRGRGAHAAGIVAGRLVVTAGTDWLGGGETKVWLSDTVVFRDGAWLPGPSLPTGLGEPMFAHDEHGLYVAGGADGTRRLDGVYALRRLDPPTEWEPLTPLPEARRAGAAACLAGRLYVACGEAAGGISTQMWSLNPAKPGSIWRRCADLPGEARAFPSLVASNGCLYLLGGSRSLSPLSPMADCYRYEPVKDSWERLRDLPWPGYAWKAARVDETHLLLAGRADGEIHADIWLLALPDMSARKIGDAVIQTTTAPLIQVRDSEWWLISGEPTMTKERTPRVTVIRYGRRDPK